MRGLAASDEEPETTLLPSVAGQALEVPRIALSLGDTSPAYGEESTFTITLSRQDGSPVLGERTVKLYYSSNGEDWSYKRYCAVDGVAKGTIRPLGLKYYKAVFWSDGEYASAIGEPIEAQPTTYLTKPGIAPKKVSSGQEFYVRGYVRPDHKAGSREIGLQCFRKEGDDWVLRKTVWTRCYDYTTTTAKYGSRVSLGKGYWKIRAYHPEDLQTRHRVTSYDYITVN